MIFICDVMLGKLARYLRILGLDTRYIRQGEDMPSFPVPGIGSLFFTKRKGMASGENTVVIRSDNPRLQLKEIAEHIQRHFDPSAMMTRCMECNSKLASTPKEDIEQFVPEYVYHHHEAFKTCPSCKKVYWEGTHVDKMREWLQDIISLEG